MPTNPVPQVTVACLIVNNSTDIYILLYCMAEWLVEPIVNILSRKVG